MSDDDEQIPTLDEWLERWEAMKESGHTSITRDEAEKRYYQTYGHETNPDGTRCF